ncbi:MAG: hypothetical protein AAF958_20050, partial [Planctomycetota bacterium]
MSASDQLERFTESAPFAVLTRAVVHELLDPDQLDALFELNSVEQYERMIPFYAVVYAMAELALGTIS